MMSGKQYKHEVLGAKCWIQFFVDDDDTHRFYRGTIRELRIKLLQRRCGENTLEIEHFILFDDGDERWFDLQYEESEGRLKWSEEDDDQKKPAAVPSRNPDVVESSSAPTPTTPNRIPDPAPSSSAPCATAATPDQPTVVATAAVTGLANPVSTRTTTATPKPPPTKRPVTTSFSKHAKRLQTEASASKRHSDDDDDFELRVAEKSRSVTKRRMTRNGVSALPLETILSATRDEETYKYFDMKTECLSIVGYDQSPFCPKKRKRTKKLGRKFQAFPHYFEDIGKTLWTAELRFVVHVYLSCIEGEAILPPLGELRFHKGRAYYEDANMALLALYINVLVREAGQRDCAESDDCNGIRDDDVDPAWSKRILPIQRVGKLNDFVVLHEKSDPSDRMIGCLFFRGNNRVLSIPTDANDITAKWQCYKLSDYVKSSGH